MTCVLCCCYISYFDFPEFPSLSFINIFRLAFSILNFSAKTFHIFLTFQVTSKCRRSQRMARQLLRIQTESCPMCAKITRRAALKTRIKQTFLRLEEEKYSPFFCLTLWKKTNPHHHHHYYHHPPNPSFFHLFFRTDLKKQNKKGKADLQLEIWSYFLCLLLFEHTHTRNKRNCPPSKQKIKIHHDNKKYSQ